MSTVPPTTGVPTTTLTTSPPTTVAPTTAIPDYDIVVDPIEIELDVRAIHHYYPPVEVNPALDNELEFDPIEITISQEGIAGNVGIDTSPIDITLGFGTNSLVIGIVIDPDPIDIVIVPVFTEYFIDKELCNWVKWSKIGELDFTIDESNIAGKRPMDWSGCVYHLGKLRDTVAVYGAGGVSLLKASGVHWGMDTIHWIGLKNKGAFCGTELVHFFIDKEGRLFKLSDKLERLDYSEFLSTLGDVVMSLDIEKNLIYITDGTTGYIYGIENGSFGQGPANITGVGVQSGSLYAVSYGAIITPKFSIKTDIYDLGSRKPKTIERVEVGTDAGEHLFMSVDYRKNYREPFRGIGWFLVNPDGRAYPKCYGVEFRFRLTSSIYEYFELDYLKIRGHIHGYSYLDTA